MGKECGTWVSRRLWGGGNTSLLKRTAWEATLIENGFCFNNLSNSCLLSQHTGAPLNTEHSKNVSVYR